MTTKINQKEYLKKYLSGDKKKKKRKDKSSKSGSNVKIIDDDVDVSKLHQIDDEDPFALGEDAPQVVGMIDDRPPELRAKEDFKNSTKWKLLNDVGKSPRRSSSPWGKSAKRLDSNHFPSRKSRSNRSSDMSPKRVRSPDMSPPRQKRRSRNRSPPMHKKKTPDVSPPRQRRNSPDMSPPRQRKPSLDLSPSRNRKTRTPDLSPIRVKRERVGHSSDLSPARRRNNSTSDISPRRRNQLSDRPAYRRNRTPALSPVRVKQERTSRFSDQSPARRRLDRSPDLPRHRRNNHSHERKQKSNRSLDFSPRPPSPQRRRKESPDMASTTRVKTERMSRSPILSPAQRWPNRSPDYSYDRNRSPIQIKQERRSRSVDNSPPRRTRTPEKKSRWDKKESRERSPRKDKSPEISGKMTKTLDGKVAGLQDAKALRIENEKFKKRENEIFNKMSVEMSGRYADTVVREKSGKRKDIEKEIREEMEKKKKHEKRKEVYTRWNKGVKQTEDYKKKLVEVVHEMDKPLARYSNDVDLEDHYKQQEREGDTMLSYLKGKHKDKNRKAGIPERPIYKGLFPNNRYNIRPGYRWDGVDRSNGYEKKWFEMQSNKKAIAEEAYKYSVEDM